MTKEIICVACPMGCGMHVEYSESNEVTRVTGNTCKRGEAYAKAELTNPTRLFHSTVRVENGKLLSVKSAGPVPKAKLMDCAKATKTIKAKAPVAIGDVIIPNVCGTGIDLVATSRC